MSFPAKLIRFSLSALFFIVPLIFLPSTSELFEFNKMIAVYLISMVIAAAWAIEMIFQKRFLFRRTPLDLPLLLFLAFQLLSLAFSLDVRTSLLGYYSRFNGGFTSFACYSLLYWAFVTFMDRKSTATTLSWTLISCLLVSVYGVLEHFGIDSTLWIQDVQNRVFSTLGQPNWLAAYLVALIFIPLSYFVVIPSSELRKGRSGGVRYFLLFLLFFLTLLYTKSRSGLLAFGFSSLVFWAITVLRDRKAKTTLKIKNLKFKIALFLFLTLTLTLTIRNPVQEKVLQFVHLQLASESTPAPSGPALEVGGTESGIIRQIVWTGAIRAWQSSPKTILIGTGPETFTMAYYRHRPVEHNATSEWELLYNKAHNEFLNYLTTTGIFGLGSYLFLLAAMLRVLIKVLKLYPESFTLNSALICGFLTIPVTNFWGFSVVIVQIFMFLLPALTLSLSRPPSDHSEAPTPSLSSGQILSTLAVLAVGSFLTISVFRYWLADVKYAAGQNEIKAFKLSQETAYLLMSHESLRQAFELNPADPAISSEYAQAKAYISLLTADSDSTASAQLADEALLLSELAISQSPYHPNYYKTAARTAILLSTVNPDLTEMAFSALQAARQISPTDPIIPFNLGVLYTYVGNYQAAKDQFNQALNLKPDYPAASDQLQQLNSATSSSDSIQ